MAPRDTIDDNTAGPGAWPAQESESRQRKFFDETRLRDALRQLAEGINALHQSGKLHRDIKPPNVLVTAEGRVVLLDFGLTADLESLADSMRSTARSSGRSATCRRNSRRAGRSRRPATGTASGSCCYEAMTGRLPFGGSPDEVLIAKQTQSPPSPDSLVVGLPEDLVRLCVALLDRDPPETTDGP